MDPLLTDFPPHPVKRYFPYMEFDVFGHRIIVQLERQGYAAFGYKLACDHLLVTKGWLNSMRVEVEYRLSESLWRLLRRIVTDVFE